MLAALGFVTAACSALPPPGDEAPFRDVAARIGHAPGLEDATDSERLHALLAEPLTPRTAAETALLNNHALKAELEELGVVWAEALAPARLKNPTLDIAARFPGPELDLGLMQNIMTLLERPARRDIAESTYEAKRLELSARILDLDHDVATAAHELQAALMTKALLEDNLSAADAAYELGRELRAAGNLSELVFLTEQVAYENARLALAEHELVVSGLRERLTSLMGLWGADANWEMAPTLAKPPAAEPPLDDLEARAIDSRYELASLRQEIDARRQELALAKRWGWAGNDGEAGVESERHGDGDWASGPSVKLALPIFDRGETKAARAAARLRAAEHRLEALAIDVRAEVRAARQRLATQRKLIEHYDTVLLPLYARRVELSFKEYNYMLVGPDTLLGVKQQEIDAKRRAVEALEAYWLARANLERAIGGRLLGEAP